MAWKWYDIMGYRASAGSKNYYGIVQLTGDKFFAFLYFHKEGPLPDTFVSTNDVEVGTFYGHMDFQQMQMIVDLLRNESPLRLGWDEENPNDFHLMTGEEPVGEGDGILEKVAS